MADNYTTPKEEVKQNQLTCVKCLGVFDEKEEFCPHCKCPALWSQPEFKQKRQAMAAGQTPKGQPDFVYQEAALLQKTRKTRDFTKPMLLLAALIIIAVSVYYVVDKGNSQPTEAQVSAIQMVQEHQILDDGTTVKQMFLELDQATSEYIRVIGWKAKQVEGDVYFVCYVVDNDMSDGNGNQQYFFEADLKIKQVTAANPALTAKYKELGYLK